jgi:hypothetical protein
MQAPLTVSENYRHARIAGGSAIDLVPLVFHERDHGYASTKLQPSTHTSELGSISDAGATSQRDRPRSIRAQVCRFFKTRAWRFGLHGGLYACVLVLISNTALLLTGVIARDDTFKGISTIAKGEMHRITTMSTAYHVLINVLSTILLTSTNYAMQVLSAPTRREVEKAHARGQWLDIGIMSVHNLRHIDRKRVVVWVLLAFSSAPLHLL